MASWKKKTAGVLIVASIAFAGLFPILHARKAEAQVGAAIGAGVSCGLKAIAGFFGFGTGCDYDAMMKAVAQAMVRAAIERIVNDTIRWAQSGFEGGPAYVTDPGQYFLNVGDRVAGEYIMGSDLAGLCSPFRAQVRLSLRNAYVRQEAPLQCTLSGVIGNIEDFYQSFGAGGWDAWFTMTQNPANNPYGAYIEAQIELDRRVARAVGLSEQQLSWDSGFLAWSECEAASEPNEYILDDEGMYQYNPNYVPGTTVGECIKRGPTKTPGSVISEQLNRTLWVPTEQLLSAESIDAVITAFVEGLMKRYVFSNQGLFDTNSAPPPRINTPPPASDTAGINEIDLDGDGISDGLDTNGDGVPDQCHFGREFSFRGNTYGPCLTSGEVGAAIPVVGQEIGRVIGDGMNQSPNNPGGGGGGGFCDAASARYAGVLQQAMSAVLSNNPDVAALNPQVNEPRNGREFRVNAYNFLTLVAQELGRMGYSATADVLNGNSNPSTGDIIGVWGPGDSMMERYDAINGSATTMANAPQTDFTGAIPLNCTASGGGGNCSCSTGGGGGGNGTGGGFCPAGNMGNSAGAPSSINFSDIIWDENPGVGGWSQTATLSSVSLCGSNCISIPYSAANTWPSIYYSMFNGDPVVGTAWIVVWRNGAWHGATWDWLRPGQTQKGLENIMGADGTLRGPLGNFSPKTGEMYGFMITTPARDGRQESNQRTNLVTMVWNGPTCSTYGGGSGGGGTGGTPGTGIPSITSISPTSGATGQSINIFGSNLTNTVQFLTSGGTYTVTGTRNSSGTQVSVQAPVGAPQGTGSVRVYRDASTQSNSVSFTISGTGGGGPSLPAVSPTSSISPAPTSDGWWPRLSPDGRYVAYGNAGSWVTDRTTGQTWNISTPADLAGTAHRCYGGQWITPVTLTMKCEANGTAYRYQATAGTWTPTRTSDTPALLFSSQFLARDGNWASWTAGVGTLAWNNQVVATGVGGAMAISGNQIVHACTNSNAQICVRNGGNLTNTYNAMAALNEMTTTGGYIAYGGYGPIMGIAPNGTQTNLRLSASYNEGAGSAAGRGQHGSSAQILLVSGTYWIATAADGPGGSYIFLRPWGSNTAIVVAAPASSLSVAVSGNEFIIAHNSDTGALRVITVPVNSPRIPIP